MFARHDLRHASTDRRSRAGKRLGPPKLGDGTAVPDPVTRRPAAPGSDPLGLCVSGFLPFQQGGAGDFQGSFQIRTPPPHLPRAVPSLARVGLAALHNQSNVPTPW